MENNYRNISDVYSAYMSPDGIYIKLPVPLGSYLYEIIMECDNICKSNPELFRQQLGRPCSFKDRLIDRQCAARFTFIQRITLDIDNIGKVLRRYELTIFDTKEKAEEAGKKLQQKRIEKLREKGFIINDDGTIPKK